MPDVPYSVQSNITSDGLNSLVKALLNNVTNISNRLQFDFLLLNEYLKGCLSDHLREKNISSEDNIVLEYIEKLPPPKLEESLLHDDWVSAVKMRDKWILTGCYDNSVYLWNKKGELVLAIVGHTKPVRAVEWIQLDNNTGKFISCSHDQTALLWNWSIDENSAECVCVCKGHERGIDSVAVCPEKQRFATGSWDTMLKVWSIDEDKDNVLESYQKKRSKTEGPTVKVRKNVHSL